MSHKFDDLSCHHVSLTFDAVHLPNIMTLLQVFEENVSICRHDLEKSAFSVFLIAVVVKRVVDLRLAIQVFYVLGP